MKTFSLRLDNAILEAIGEAAKQQRLSKQQWVENAIRDRLEQPSETVTVKRMVGRRVVEKTVAPKKLRAGKCDCFGIRVGSFCKHHGVTKA